MRLIVFLTLIIASHYANSLDELLEKYKKESELSKITKSDTAGLSYIFTREELERMQAYSLKDVLRLISGLNYTITPNGLNLFSNTSTTFVSITGIRVYINDHDLTSASFGNALLIWGDMPLEYIDHIEIYKGTSSIEFGDETGVLIIKIYTKLAEREEDKKIRVIKDTLGSGGFDTYIAKTLNETDSLFFYIHALNKNSKHYEHRGHTISKDKEDFSFYANYKNSKFTIEAGSIKIDKDPYLGNGRNYTPTGGGLDAAHSYAVFNKNFDGLKLSIGFDRLEYDRTYKDNSKIYTSKGYVKDYNINFQDDIFSIRLKKEFKHNKNSLLLGGFFKYKEFEADGKFDNLRTDFSNHLNLFSIYAEDTYRFSDDLLTIFSLKKDFYKYKKEVPSKNKLIARVGVIKNFDELQIKAFYTKSYLPPTFYYLYSKEGFPLVTNKKLKYPDINIATFEIYYKKDNYKIDIRAGKKRLKNKIIYSKNGYVNISKNIKTSFFELNYKYLFNMNNYLYLSFVKGKNSIEKLSPDININLRLFNKFGKFEIYNELLYKNGYDYPCINKNLCSEKRTKIDSSLDYTASIKYHINRDLSIGIRGENILNRGFKQAYNKTDKTFFIVDRRFIFNMEYLF